MHKAGERDMKRGVTVIATLLCLGAPMVSVQAFDVPQIEGYDIFNETAQSIINGKFSLNPMSVLGNVAQSVGGEIKAFSAVAGVMLVICLLSSMTGTLNSALGQRSTANAAFFTFFTVISGLALTCFLKAFSYGNEVISYMASFMNKLTPIVIMTLFACSKTASAAAFEPVLSASVFVATEIIEKCLVPLIAFSAILSVAGNAGDKNRISGFVKIVKSITRWLMALVITVFTGINTIYGFTAPAIDAVTTKTLKFAVGSLVPVVGGFLSDTLDTVATSAAVMKNAVGVSGIIIMCVICVSPIIKIGIMQFILKLISALCEPITDARISAMLWDMSEAVTAIFGMVVLTAVLFLINICIILRVTG